MELSNTLSIRLLLVYRALLGCLLYLLGLRYVRYALELGGFALAGLGIVMMES